jgi:hypothetical protein
MTAPDHGLNKLVGSSRVELRPDHCKALCDDSNVVAEALEQDLSVASVLGKTSRRPSRNSVRNDTSSAPIRSPSRSIASEVSTSIRVVLGYFALDRSRTSTLPITARLTAKEIAGHGDRVNNTTTPFTAATRAMTSISVGRMRASTQKGQPIFRPSPPKSLG